MLIRSRYHFGLRREAEMISVNGYNFEAQAYLGPLCDASIRCAKFGSDRTCGGVWRRRLRVSASRSHGDEPGVVVSAGPLATISRMTMPGMMARKR